MDFYSAVCIKIGKQGSVSCEPEVELWCDGKRVDWPKYGSLSDRKSDEITLTVRKVDGGKSRKVEYRVTVSGMRRFNRSFDEPSPRKQSKVRFGPVSLEKPL